MIEGEIKKGPGFWLKDLIEGRDFTEAGIHVVSPAPLVTIGWMCFSMIFYIFFVRFVFISIHLTSRCGILTMYWPDSTDHLNHLFFFSCQG
jgi:hypothetical protein